jgi:ACS family glucarate transporter-like MFS transporter
VSQTATSRVRWFLVAWLFILSAVAFLDRVNLSVAGSSLAGEYHLTDIQLGVMFSAFLLGYALFQTPSGWLADRFGPRRVLAGGVLWWGIFTALTAAVPVTVAKPILFFLAIRFLLGAGEAVVYPASNQFVARWIPTQERGIANGWIFAGVGAGSGLSPSLITYVMLRHGWRSSFWLCAIIGLAVGTVWYIAARDAPDQHPLVSASEMTAIRAGLTFQGPRPNGAALSAQNRRAPRTTVPWRKILSGKNVWAVTFSYFCYGYVAWIFFSWFYIYLAKVRGLNLKASAFYGTLPFLAMAACCPLGGLVSDWLTRRAGRRIGRCGVAFIGLGLAGVFLAFGSSVHSARLASVVLAGGAGALYLSQSSFWSVCADIAGGFSGSVSGFMNMGAQLGGAVTASLTPAIALRYGWTSSFLAAAFLCALAAAAWLLVDPEHTLIPAAAAV